MAEIIERKSEKHGSVSAMGKEDLINYLEDMKSGLAYKGFNLSALGIEGLSNATVFKDIPLEDLMRYANAIATHGS
jgi:hypothetical protein